MNDGNMIYITLNKVENINRFNSLYYHLLKRVKDNNLEISDEWRNNKKSFEKWYKENKYAEFLEVDKDILSIYSLSIYKSNY